MNQKQLDADIVTQVQLALMRTTGTKRRGQHIKQHGCVQADFTVLDEIPEDLKTGLFAAPASYSAYIRFSNGGKMDDRIPDIHGMAIKLLGVPGTKVLEGEETATTHDFILADNPVFFIRTAAEYVRFIKDFAESAALGKRPERFIAWLAENHPEDVPVYSEFTQQKLDSPLSGEFWSQVPYALGVSNKRICRYSIVPHPDNPVFKMPAEQRSENYLGQAMVQGLATDGEGAGFDFYIQPLADTSYDVVNNPTVNWDTPRHKVAVISLPPQVFDTPEQQAFGKNLSYTPWHALPEHCPVGEVNEIRKQVYLASSGLRHKSNGTIAAEPE